MGVSCCARGGGFSRFNGYRLASFSRHRNWVADANHAVAHDGGFEAAAMFQSFENTR